MAFVPFSQAAAARGTGPGGPQAAGTPLRATASGDFVDPIFGGQFLSGNVAAAYQPGFRPNLDASGRALDIASQQFLDLQRAGTTGKLGSAGRDIGAQGAGQIRSFFSPPAGAPPAGMPRTARVPGIQPLSGGPAPQAGTQPGHAMVIPQTSSGGGMSGLPGAGGRLAGNPLLNMGGGQPATGGGNFQQMLLQMLQGGGRPGQPGAGVQPQGATPVSAGGPQMIRPMGSVGAPTPTPQIAPLSGSTGAPSPTAAQALGINTTRIDPNDNLRGQQINPGGGPNFLDPLIGTIAGDIGQGAPQIGEFAPIQRTDFSAQRGLLDRATAEAGNIRDLDFQGIGAGSFSGSQAGDTARRTAMRALGGLEGPDRIQLALNAFNRFREEQDPVFAQRQREVGQRAAALGRVGAGLTTNELTDLETQRNRDEARARGALIDQATGQTLADRLGILSGALGAGGQFRSEDLAQAGFQQGLRNEARAERGMGLEAQLANAGLAGERADLLRGLSSDMFGFSDRARGEAERDRQFDFGRQALNANLNLAGRGQDLGAFNSLAGLQNQLFGQGLTNREELRGERARQDQLGQQSIENRIQQALLESQLGNTQFLQELERLRLGGGLGITGADPTFALSQPIAGSDPSGGDIGSLIAAYLQQRGGAGGGSTSNFGQLGQPA